MISPTVRDRWTLYAAATAATAEPKGEATKRLCVERAKARDEIRVSIVGADATMQQAVYLTASEARDLRDMLAQALDIDVEAEAA
ncbi:MAG: hypothetical protein HYZ20_19765 [Burkholderiales bacterium]|nr:hypothetical protein [Burkholderiales bacterium]